MLLQYPSVEYKNKQTKNQGQNNKNKKVGKDTSNELFFDNSPLPGVKLATLWGESEDEGIISYV